MTANYEDTVCINCYTHLERAIAKIANCEWAGEGYPLHKSGERLLETVNRVMPNADWVLYYGFEVMLKKMNVQIPPKKKRNFKIGIYTGDIHRVPDQQINYINGHGWDALLMLYTKLGAYVNNRLRKVDKTDPEYYLKNVKIPIFHMAPCVSPEVFKPVDAPKKFDATFLGAVGHPWYPLRYRVYRQLPRIADKEGWNVIVRLSPPGRSLTRKMSRLYGQHYVGSRYATVLALSKIFIFGTSIFKYPLLKFPEAMACKTCVMADTPYTAEELHLVPGYNYVAINENNWVARLKYYIKHDKEREEIAERGYETFLKYHTTDIRAQQVVDFLGSLM